MKTDDSILNLKAVDVHGHFGTSAHGVSELADGWMTGSAEEVVERANMARTKITIVSAMTALWPPLKGDCIKGNCESKQAVQDNDNLMFWAVINPLAPETFEQAEEMLSCRKCAGIKIHPQLHGYPIKEHGEAIFSFAAKNHAIIKTHSGESKCIPEDYVPFANDFPVVPLILAHLGNTCDGDPSHQVKAILASKHGNTHTDTSSSQSIMPNLIEWAVGEVGAEHILYGTDTPLYFAPMQRSRIDYAAISDQDKRKILHDNAVNILGL